MRILRRMLGALAIGFALCGGAGTAQADCVVSGIRSITGATVGLGSFGNTTTVIPKFMTLTISLNVSGTGDCTFSIAFSSLTNPAAMSGATADRLRYDVQTLSGTSLVYTASPSAIQTTVVSHTNASQISATVSVQAVAVGGQTVTAGGYSDGSLGIAVFNGSVATTPVGIWLGTFINAAVSPSCKINGQFAATDAAGISVPVSSSSVVTTATIQRDYANVVCNAPSDISMSSQNTGLTNPVAVSGLVKNVIHYSAEARLGTATATLDTSVPNSMTLGRIDTTTGASGALSVRVTPQQPPDGYRLADGRYNDVLLVTLTPR
jgi:hypothetical protein